MAKGNLSTYELYTMMRFVLTKISSDMEREIVDPKLSVPMAEALQTNKVLVDRLNDELGAAIEDPPKGGKDGTGDTDT